MPQLINYVTVFLSSPSDVSHERDVVTKVVDEWNNRYASSQKTLFGLLKWETNVSAGFGQDGQTVINDQIGSQYDVLIAIFSTRLGTPTARSSSGSVEEYERAFERYKQGKGVEIAFFFKESLVDSRSIDLEQLSLLRSFEKEVQGSGALTKTFKDDEGLRLEIGILLDRLAKSFSLDQDDLPRSVPALHTSNLPAPQRQHNSVVASADEDVGLFDAIENMQQHAASGSEFLDGFTRYITELGTITENVTNEFIEIRSLRALEPDEAKPGILRVANAMDQLSGFLEAELPEYGENILALCNDVRDIIRVTYDWIEDPDYESETLEPFKTMIVSMRSAIVTSNNSFSEMIQTTASLQRTTSVFNRAKRRLVNNAALVTKTNENSISLITQAIDELNRLIDAANSNRLHEE